MKPLRLVATAVGILLTLTPAARADTADRLLQLISIAGVAGYERPVAQAIEGMLPKTARVITDNLGNIIIHLGTGAPHTLVVAPLDEPGFVVSAITDDGYLRVHRHTTAPGPSLTMQFFIGQPIQIHTSSGTVVPGVTATPSAHLRGMRDPQEERRIKTIDDVWIDVGAESRAEVAKLGVRLLDSLTLRERATRLAGSRVSGVSAANRAAALAAAEVIRRSSGTAATGGVSFAWVTQTEYGNRGLLRLLESLKPARVIVLRGAGNPGDEARGAAGRLGGGPILGEGASMLKTAAQATQLAVQTMADARLQIAVPDRWKQVELHVATLPVVFAQTPVETVDARDVDALATLVASAVGLSPLGPPDATKVEPPPPPPARRLTYADEKPLETFGTLGALIELYGVSGHETPVREQVIKRLPLWARSFTDNRGNVSVTFGKGGKPLVFVAHLDEVGFELASIADDGAATVRTRGGMYLSVYEAHPVLVHTPKGPVPALLAPRTGYTTAKEAQPAAEALRLYFGTDNAAETSALGVVVGQSATVRKRFSRLAGNRATGRSMDDRSGSTALLMALTHILPPDIGNQITFAWTVEEETGLAGAAYLATKLQPDTVFAVDTFVSTDTPVDIQRLAGAKLGQGAVLRVLDSRTIVPPHIVDRIVAIAREAKIPLQLGTTSGGTDASAFSAGGAIDVGLSWPGRYSHSPVEVMDRRDLDALVQLIVALVKNY